MNVIDDLRKARDKEQEYRNRGVRLPCWMSGIHGCTYGPPHELANCRQLSEFDNYKRYRAARDKEAGPGVQCFTCLSSVCFLE